MTADPLTGLTQLLQKVQGAKPQRRELKIGNVTIKSYHRVIWEEVLFPWCGAGSSYPDHFTLTLILVGF